MHGLRQLKILYGGMNGPHGVHVIIHGGDACQAIVEAFREAFPEHYPTRIDDVCFDFQGDKAYDKPLRPRPQNQAQV